eukprot:361334-Chlamydomonas_euryale.AAC.5
MGAALRQPLLLALGMQRARQARPDGAAPPPPRQARHATQQRALERGQWYPITQRAAVSATAAQRRCVPAGLARQARACGFRARLRLWRRALRVRGRRRHTRGAGRSRSGGCGRGAAGVGAVCGRSLAPSRECKRHGAVVHVAPRAVAESALEQRCKPRVLRPHRVACVDAGVDVGADGGLKPCLGA